MDKKVLDSICKLIENELERLSKQPSLDNTTLNQLHVLTDTKKNLLKIETLEMEMEEPYEEDMGYSSRRGGGRSNRGGSYAQSRMGGSYGNSGYGMNSYAPYYGGQGSYEGGGGSGYPRASSYEGGYSRGDAYSHLEQAMREAGSEKEREEIRSLMSRLYK